MILYFYLETFKYGTRGENICPSGYSYVTTIDDCKSAAEVLGTNYRWDNDDSDIPKGCYWSSDFLYFNIHASGSESSSRKLVCKQGMVFSLY